MIGEVVSVQFFNLCPADQSGSVKSFLGSVEMFKVILNFELICFFICSLLFQRFCDLNIIEKHRAEDSLA